MNDENKKDEVFGDVEEPEEIEELEEIEEPEALDEDGDSVESDPAGFDDADFETLQIAEDDDEDGAEIDPASFDDEDFETLEIAEDDDEDGAEIDPASFDDEDFETLEIAEDDNEDGAEFDTADFDDVNFVTAVINGGDDADFDPASFDDDDFETLEIAEDDGAFDEDETESDDEDESYPDDENNAIAEPLNDVLDLDLAVAEFTKLVGGELSGGKSATGGVDDIDDSDEEYEEYEEDGEEEEEELTDDESVEEDGEAVSESFATLSGQKATGMAAILVASMVVVMALVFTAIFKKPETTSGHVSYGYVSSSEFVTDSDSISIDDITDDVIGMGVLYEDAKVYDAVGGDVAGELSGGTTLMIYEAAGDYYRASDSENSVTGYVLKKAVNTGGIDIGNPTPDWEIVDDETGEILETVPYEETTAKTTTTTTTTKKETKTTTVKGEQSTTTAKDSTTTTAATTDKTTTTTKSNASGINPEDFPVNASPYFVYVEKGSHTITIYAKDSHGKYTTAVRTYLTATGRTTSLTPVGLFSVGGKEQWHSWGGRSYSPYCSKYYNGLFFHGPLYSKKNFGTLIESSVSGIGTNASSGCMRTSAQAAYFIYAFCPSGTYVKIVNGSPLAKGAGRPSISSQYVDPATNKVPTAGISLTTTAKTLKVGETYDATVIFEPSNASEKACYWVSSNTKVASVKSNNASCTVTAKGAGTAVITATSVDGSYKATLTVTVTDPTATTTTETTTTTTTETTTTTTTGTESTTTTTQPSETTTTTTAVKPSETTTTMTKATKTTTTTTKPSETTTTTTKASKTTTSTTKASETTSTTTTTKATTTTTAATTTTTKATTTTKVTTATTDAVAAG